MRIYILELIFCIGLINILLGQQQYQIDSLGKWAAYWLTPEANPNGYGVYHYRKTFDLETKPASCIVHVSADQRYELYVNGKRICYGPARSDFIRWQYETVDLAPYLSEGKNVLAAVNWNYGKQTYWAQLSEKTGFILQAEGPLAKELNTNQNWLCYENKAYTPYRKAVPVFATGVEDRIDGNLYPWGWERLDYNDKHWKPAHVGWDSHGYSVGYPVPQNKWPLAPRIIPLMQDSLIQTFIVRRQSGLPKNIQRIEDLNIPAHSHVTILLDHTVLTNAYPILEISRGKNAEIELTYVECLMDSAQLYSTYDIGASKRHRDSIEGLKAIGISDVFISDGGLKRTYRPLWFRNFRYIELQIKTKSEPLIVHKLEGMFTGYPLRQQAGFSSSDPSLEKIWQVGFRTARLCAHETYFDCPYYEQLQYVGDTRIQALMSYYLANDDRLAKNAILHFVQSQTYEGLTRSSWPANGLQYIPPFSLFWTLMLYDYYWYRGDVEFVKPMLANAKRVIEWHKKYLNKEQLLENLPYWNFVDWPDAWPWDNQKGYGGIPSGGIKGISSILNLQYVYTLRQLAALLEASGDTLTANNYRSLAAQTGAAVWKHCWDKSKNRLADAPHSTDFSQHANLWLVLCDILPQQEHKKFMQEIIQDPSLIPCTLYYKFYLFQAMKKAGLGNLYLDQLKEWHDMIQHGLTTFAERPGSTRSDCHAWSASPLIDLLAMVLGVEPMQPGFKKIRIQPHPGKLTFLKGQVLTPQGMVKIFLKKDKKGWNGTVELPKNVEGEFVLENISKKLNSGLNRIF